MGPKRDRSHTIRIAGFGLLLLAATAGAAGGQGKAASGPRFVGTVKIADQAADPGTMVDVVIFRAGQTPIPCAHATVGVSSAGVGQSSAPGYVAPLDQTAICLNPDNVYHFYVNGVRAPQKSGAALPGTRLTYVHLDVPEAALKTSPDQDGVRLVWFYGKVRDRVGRPAPDGTTVTAEARGATCSGTGKTQDLYWVPKAAGSKTIGALGWYLIPVEISVGCADRALVFDLHAGPKRGPGKASGISTPPYGGAVNVDVELPPAADA